MSKIVLMIVLAASLVPISAGVSQAGRGAPGLAATSYKLPGNQRLCRPTCVRSATGKVHCSCG